MLIDAWILWLLSLSQPDFASGFTKDAPHIEQGAAKKSSQGASSDSTIAMPHPTDVKDGSKKKLLPSRQISNGY